MDILLGGADVPPRLLLKYANRHGLVAGATGTGKTVTLQVLTEGFSRAGVPVFVADVKGDLSGLSIPGAPNSGIQKRVDSIGIEGFEHEGMPTVFWDLFGKQGHPIRTTVMEMGPWLLARMLDLNETQEGVLNIAFAAAADDDHLILDLKDLRAMLQFVADNAAELSPKYGNVSKASVGAIVRRLLVLEQQGAKQFFGEPALDIHDFMQSHDGKGQVNILAADQLMQTPTLYAMFLVWLLNELFEELPEAGDQDKPKLVFFFDEAHLLFDGAPKALLEKVNQIARLIRSKGVGVYFVSQSPTDIPDDVLGQLGNRIQHALRAYTPKDQKAIKAAAQSFRANPELDVARTIGELGVGEALVSVLDHKGRPTMVQQTLLCPPRSRMGPINARQRKAAIATSPLIGVYDKAVDRESAYERLAKKAQTKRDTGHKSSKATPAKRRRSRRSRRETAGQALLKSTARSVGTQLGRSLMRGLFGGRR